LAEVIADPQPRLMGAFKEVEHARLGRFETMNTPFVIHGADVTARGPAPDAGAATYEVLLAAGMSEDDIARLAESGALG
jgi:crotonobetainyl-CoA:carnitine CoA-transferase CaiB-like acyl-CoA transferase